MNTIREEEGQWVKLQCLNQIPTNLMSIGTCMFLEIFIPALNTPIPQIPFQSMSIKYLETHINWIKLTIIKFPLALIDHKLSKIQSNISLHIIKVKIWNIWITIMMRTHLNIRRRIFIRNQKLQLFKIKVWSIGLNKKMNIHINIQRKTST